jgi:hypothetical protein
MSSFFITHVEPLHTQKGKEVLFFVREQDLGQKISRSHVVVKEVPHYFLTTNLFSEDVSSVLMQLLNDEEIRKSGLHFELNEYNHSRQFIQAEGSKEEQRILPPPFRCLGTEGEKQDPCGLNSPSKLLQWFYPPGMRLNSLEEIPLPLETAAYRKKYGYIGLEQLLTNNYAVLDIETEGWEQGKDSIFMVVYVSPQRKLIMHNFNFPKLELSEQSREQERFSLIRFDTQPELGEKLTALLHEEDPLWLFGHNIMKFDQIKLRDITKAYAPAVNRHHPIYKSVQGLGRVLTKGRFTLDSYLYHSNHRNYHADNKLEIVSEEFEKSINYKEQAELVLAARGGDTRAFQRLVSYCIGDGLATEKKGLELQGITAQKAYYFRTSPDRVCAASRSTLSRSYWRRRHFLVKGTFEDSWKGWYQQEESFSLDPLKLKFIEKKSQRGFFSDTQIVYLTPFIAAATGLKKRAEGKWQEGANMQRFLESTDEELLKKAFQSTNPEEKFELLQTLNTKLSHLVEEVQKILQRDNYDLNSITTTFSEKSERALAGLFSSHGLRVERGKLFVRNIPIALQRIQAALNKYEVINQGNYFHVILGELRQQELEEKGYGCVMGSGQVLSLSKERFITNPWNESDLDKFIYQGISLRKGNKCNFEKRVLEEVVGKIFSGEAFKTVGKYLDSEISAFLSGDKPSEEYHFIRKRRTHYRNLFGEVLGHINEEVQKEYDDFKANIGERYSSETRDKLHALMSKLQNDFSYPFLEEVLEEIEHPYPSTIELIYPKGYSCGKENVGLMLPATYGFAPDLEKYREKLNEQFRDFYTVLRPKQGELFER